MLAGEPVEIVGGMKGPEIPTEDADRVTAFVIAREFIPENANLEVGILISPAARDGTADEYRAYLGVVGIGSADLLGEGEAALAYCLIRFDSPIISASTNLS